MMKFVNRLLLLRILYDLHKRIILMMFTLFMNWWTLIFIRLFVLINLSTRTIVRYAFPVIFLLLIC